jgi:uncharacterized protein
MVSRTAEQHVSVPVLRAAWETLTFVHWRVDPAQVQPLLPEGLTVDVYDGAAWVGLTPFLMANMRPLGIPDLPAGMRLIPGVQAMPSVAELSSTPETNLRTYVRGPDGRDGLWFLSLDVGSGTLAAALRAAVGAPYHKARLTVEQQDDSVTYTGARVGASEAYLLRVRPGEPLEPTDLEVWLTSRWRAYTAHLGGLLVTPVEHEPWPLRMAALETIDQDLTGSVGLGDLGEPAAVHFSDGVRHVRVGRSVRARRSGTRR